MKIDAKGLERAANAIDCVSVVVCEGGEDDGIANLDECARAAITAYLNAIEEDGFVVVPREPTGLMVNSGADKIGGGSTFDSYDREEMALLVYRAMLAAKDAT